MLTRLGESGVDAFTIMRIAGHSSISVSQRHIHFTPEECGTAIERLQLAADAAANKPNGSHSLQTPVRRGGKLP
jgi:hypothetical protein